jgi:hypothetical protein
MKSILLLLLLCGAAFCAPYPFAQFAPPNSSYSVTQFPYSNQTAQALVLNGSELYAIFVPLGSGLAPVTDAGELQSALYDYYSYLGYSPEALNGLAAVHQGMAAANQSRAAGEADCRRILGTDTHPCTDFDSCQKACYSVTSFCQQVALGAGSDFINTIWQFENESRALGQAYGNESRAFAAFEANSSQQNAEAYLGSLDEINVAATSASSNQLFYGYSYCAEPDYNLGAITGLQLAAQRAYASASYFSSLPSYAAALRNSTLAGIARQASAAEAANATPAKSPAQNAPAANQSLAAAGAPAPASQSALPLVAAAFVLILALAAILWLAFGRKKGLMGGNRAGLLEKAKKLLGRKRRGL